MYLGMRIFEIAKGLGTLKHWVWSSLDPVAKVHFFRSRLEKKLTPPRFRKRATTQNTNAITMTQNLASCSGLEPRIPSLTMVLA